MKRFLYGSLFAAWAGLMVACGGGGAAICQKAQECNVLQGSVSECAETRSKCFANLTSGQQKDYNTAVAECAGAGTCATFTACYQQKQQAGVGCFL